MVGDGMQSKVEQKRMKDEAKSIEHRKREEAKAEQAVRAAEVNFSFSKFVFRMRSRTHCNELSVILLDVHSV